MLTANQLEQKNLTITELLGQGGSGAVYQAHQSILDREVAVKVILPVFANQPDFIRNFELEAQLIARLEHPHIVPLYDFWRDPDGAYLVMRFLRGGNLKKRLEKGALAFDEIDRLLEQLTSALTTAHRASVVHRDLKPENILLDEDGNAYLSDFGIARQTGHSPTEENISGTLAYMAPEQLMAYPTSVAMDIYSLGLILFEMLTGQYPYSGYTAGQIVQMHINETLPELQDFKPDLPEALNTIVQKATSKKPEERFEDARDLWRDFHRIISKGDTAQFDHDQVEMRNPYKGLRPFDEADSADFFGREMLITHLLERMNEAVEYRNFLAVVGASGSGKSSLIRAGVIPKLRAGKLTGSNRWFICEMVPGANPLSALGQALLSVAPGATPRLQEQLQSSPQALLWAVDNIMANVEGDLFLFIDQFEELFVQTKDETERTHFLELLRYAVSAEKSRFRVIITLRADFYDRPLHYEGFGEMMQQRSQVVLPLNAAEIEHAISGPASRVHIRVNTDLITAIVADMREEPGALPLLQYALTEVFERCGGGPLTLDAYRDIGGVEGALVRRAEAVYQNLSAPEQEIAHQLFLRLVSFGEHSADTRRRTTQSELFSINESARSDIEKVLAIFGDYRLLAFDRDSITREPVIEIAHEALIRGWDRLRNWLDESREDLRTQRQLAALAEEWVRAKRDESYLLRGTRISQFKDWANTTTLNLATSERELLNTSIEQAEKENQAREVARQEKETLRQRTVRQQRLLIYGLIGLFLITSILGGMALVAGGQARTEANQNATAQYIAEHARATSEANTTQLRTALDEIRSLGMVDTAAQDLARHDVDSAIALAFAANQIAHPPLEAQRVLATVADSVGTARLFAGHTRDVQALAFSPDGQQMVSGAYDKTLILWKVADGTVIRRFEGDPDLILSVAYSPDGKYIASGDASGLVLLWDAETGEKLREFKAHSRNVHGLVFSPDGTKLVSASADAMVIVWNAADAAIIRRMTGHFTAVTTVDYSPDGKYIASGAIDGSLIIWDAQTGERLRKWEDDPQGVNVVVFNPHQPQLLSGSNTGELSLWDSESGERLKTFTGHQNAVLSAAFSPDGREIISGSADNMLRLWDASSGETERVYAGHSGRVHAVSFSPDGTWIASASADDSVRLWLTQYVPLNIPLTLKSHADNVKQAVFSPDESLVLSSTGSLFDAETADTNLMLWDWKIGHVAGYLRGHQDSVTGVAFSPDGKQALSASRDKSLILWDLQTGAPIRHFEGHTDWVWSAVFSPDGKQALSASRDQSLILWDVATGTPIQHLLGHSDWVNAGVFSADGKQIVSGADDGKVILWDAATGKMTHTFEGHEGPVHDVAISPDGSTILSGSSDWSSILWDVQSGKIRYQFFDQQGAVNAVAFSPDGTQMVTGSADGTLIIWDAQNGERLRDFRVSSEIVRSARFSPDGEWLIASFDSGIIRIYPLNTQVTMDWIKQFVYLRPFDCAERQKFVIEPLCEGGSS